MNSGKKGDFLGGHTGKTPGALEDLKHSLDDNSSGDFQGILSVDLIKARNLIKADIMGKSDPYAVLKFGKQKDKTTTIKNTLEPQWDHHAEFKLPDGHSDKLLVEVFDADKLGKDKSLGKVEVDLSEITSSEGRWYPLEGNKNLIYKSL